ncbi:caspase family protein [Streptomyces decoyicus]|uniref:Caspase family protein n=1 Tax=Streptomyces decoyicus TaxID=249567 RepID=A0ABZ1FDF0_9ACTN|nr:DnaJ C-terminal domain-containing protein [Streptomyces decoyicus]WSB68400.1 caspase family protein [Streptomyces decoyicus]
MPGFPAGRRDALLIATGIYESPALKPLRSPRQDCEGLAAVLRDPGIGGFQVQQLVDAKSYEVKRALEQFFRNRGREDLLLLHLSCHGIKDDEGHLYFAMQDTDKDLPASTAVPAAFLHDQMARCRARTIVVLLDCCYSGAFLPGAKGDDYVQVKEELAGHGRAILTATNRTEYAWEGDHLEASAPQPSRFTGALIEGLRSGDADTDHDGRITVTELYDYVYEYLHHSGARQRPRMWADLEYRVTLARTAAGRPAADPPAADPPAADTPAASRPAAAGAPSAAESETTSWNSPPAEGEQTPPPGPGLFTRLKDAFNGVDGDGPSPPPHRQLARRGQDALLRVEFPLTETALGTLRDIQVDTAVVCDRCQGAGADAGTPVHPCGRCNGIGTSGPEPGRDTSVPCRACHGSGVRIPFPCHACTGDGRVRVTRTLTLKVPGGVDHGTRIQLAGEGEVGPGGGPPGDLYIEVVELPHPELERRGDDLHLTRRIARSLARGGGTVAVTTLDGSKSVRVPAGLRSGQTLRLVGHGAMHLRGGGRGDLLLHLDVDKDDGRAGPGR